ncbi:hypothetical protein HHI36_003286, partial [Cryptolaemus montrouzieri]
KLADQEIITIELQEVQDVQGSSPEESHASHGVTVEIENSKKILAVQNDQSPQPPQAAHQTQQAASTSQPSNTVMT